MAKYSKKRAFSPVALIILILGVALLAVIFSSMWWNLWVQLSAWSAMIWLGGLVVLLTIPGVVAAKSLLICGALQIAVTFWILYRRSRILPELRNEHPAKRKETDK